MLGWGMISQRARLGGPAALASFVSGGALPVGLFIYHPRIFIGSRVSV